MERVKVVWDNRCKDSPGVDIWEDADYKLDIQWVHIVKNNTDTIKASYDRSSVIKIERMG